MKLNRSIDAWDKCDAGAMSTMSEAAIKYAFDDAKQDIKKLASGHAQMLGIKEMLMKSVAGMLDVMSNAKDADLVGRLDKAYKELHSAYAVAHTLIREGESA